MSGPCTPTTRGLLRAEKGQLTIVQTEKTRPILSIFVELVAVALDCALAAGGVDLKISAVFNVEHIAPSRAGPDDDALQVDGPGRASAQGDPRSHGEGAERDVDDTSRAAGVEGIQDGGTSVRRSVSYGAVVGNVADLDAPFRV